MLQLSAKTSSENDVAVALDHTSRIGPRTGSTRPGLRALAIGCLTSVVVLIGTSARAQNLGDMISIFGGIARTAIAQSASAEWQTISKGQVQCMDRALVGRGASVQRAIENGIGPSDPRLAEIRKSCAAGSVQNADIPNGQSPYVVDGLPLGGKVRQDSDAYRQYRCAPSEQVADYTWCQKQKAATGANGPFTVTNSILHSGDGTAVYVNQYIQPAYFTGSEIAEQLDRLSKRFGQRPNVSRMPTRAGFPQAMIATWGAVTLESLKDSDAAIVAAGRSPNVGYLIDYLGDLQKSAASGLPVFRISGSAGYIWAASFDANGKGHLRFLEANVSAFAPITFVTTAKSSDSQPAESPSIQARLEPQVLAAANDAKPADTAPIRSANAALAQPTQTATTIDPGNIGFASDRSAPTKLEQAILDHAQSADVTSQSRSTSLNSWSIAAVLPDGATLLETLAVIIPASILIWIVTTVMGLHKRDVYFWGLGSTWTSLIACPAALVIMSFSTLSRMHDQNVPLFKGPILAGALLYAVAFAYALFYNWKATRSAVLTVSTSLLQQLAVLGLIFFFLRWSGNQANRNR